MIPAGIKITDTIISNRRKKVTEKSEARRFDGMMQNHGTMKRKKNSSIISANNLNVFDLFFRLYLNNRMINFSNAIVDNVLLPVGRILGFKKLLFELFPSTLETSGDSIEVPVCFNRIQLGNDVFKFSLLSPVH